MSKCLVCFNQIQGATGAESYHPSCAKKLFGSTLIPSIDLDLNNIEKEGLILLGKGGGIPGVQKKISLDRIPGEPKRLILQALDGLFLLKPPVKEYPFLPENEAFCMELASQLGLPVAPHGLVYCGDSRAYLSRRFDRTSNPFLQSVVKIPQEDFCQISGRISADKYKGSLEGASKCLTYSRQIGLDRQRFWELNLFAWLSGNADMHLKNFSLYAPDTENWELSPAYDLVSTRLVIPEDKEETALTLQGKKNKLQNQDWMSLAASLELPPKAAKRIITRFHKELPLVQNLCRNSFLPTEQQEAFLATWENRLKILEL